MDLEKVYKDYNWHPMDGDYFHLMKDQEHHSKKEAEKKSRSAGFIIFSVLILFLIIGILTMI